MRSNRLMSVLAISVLAATSLAHARDNHWQAEPVRQSMDQMGSATGGHTYSGVRVWTRDQNIPEIRFGCSERFGLIANINFSPALQADASKTSRLQLRQMSTNLTIEGRKAERVPWTVIKETRTVQTRSSKHAAMIYNAVVQGRTITVQEPDKKTVTLTPPPVDQSFTWFAENCPITAP